MPEHDATARSATASGRPDLTDPDTFIAGAPHEAFARMRRDEPVAWHQEEGAAGFWSLTRYGDVVAVNRDHETFSSSRGGVLLRDLPEEVLARQRLMMLNMDPPRHTRYRRLVGRAFTPRRVAGLEPRIREMVRNLLATLLTRGGGDAVVDLAAELPLQVIADLMGLPAEDRHRLFTWSNLLIGSEDPEYRPSAEETASAFVELRDYVHDLAAHRRQAPGDDLFSGLLHTDLDGERLSEIEIDLFFLLLLVAGNETTRNLISHGLLALIEHPAEWSRLGEDPGLVPSAVEEMLRWATPVRYFRRTAQRDTTLGGQRIAEGDKVVIWYASANRDESVFVDPDRFDVGRTPNDHVAFGGGGPHFCLGASLARLEARVTFEEVVAQVGEVALAGPVAPLRSTLVNGIKHLPVRVSRRPAPARVPR